MAIETFEKKRIKEKERLFKNIEGVISSGEQYTAQLTEEEAKKLFGYDAIKNTIDLTPLGESYRGTVEKVCSYLGDGRPIKITITQVTK